MLASLAPSGRYIAEDLHRAGGSATLLRELCGAATSTAHAPTVDGRDARGATAGAPARR